MKTVLKNIGTTDVTLQRDASYVQLIPVYYYDGVVCSPSPRDADMTFVDHDDPEIDSALEYYVRQEEAALAAKKRGPDGFGSTGATGKTVKKEDDEEEATKMGEAVVVAE